MLTWVSRNRLVLLNTALMLVLGATMYDPVEPGKAWFAFLALTTQLAAMYLDSRRVIREIRFGRTRLWPREPVDV